MLAGVRSKRKTNSGLAIIAWIAVRIPDSKSPSLRPRLIEAEQRFQIVRRHRPAVSLPRQRRQMIFLAQGISSVAVAGRQAKILRRLGVSETPAAFVGTGDAQLVQMRQRRHAGQRARADVHQALLHHPILIFDRPVELLRERSRNPLRSGVNLDRRSLDAVLGQRHRRIDIDQRHPLAVHRDFDLLALALIHAEQRTGGRVVESDLENVLAVGRKIVHHRHAAARSERRALHVAYLREHARNGVSVSQRQARRDRRPLRG